MAVITGSQGSDQACPASQAGLQFPVRDVNLSDSLCFSEKGHGGLPLTLGRPRLLFFFQTQNLKPLIYQGKGM